MECDINSCKFAGENIGVAKFLELNSETKHDDHCLAYMFTYRDFDDGVLGLAWIGEACKLSRAFLTEMISRRICLTFFKLDHHLHAD